MCSYNRKYLSVFVKVGRYVIREGEGLIMFKFFYVTKKIIKFTRLQNFNVSTYTNDIE